MSAKSEWFDRLAAKKRARGYSEEEVAAYRAGLEEKYARFSVAEFEAVLGDRDRQAEREPGGFYGGGEER